MYVGARGGVRVSTCVRVYVCVCVLFAYLARMQYIYIALIIIHSSVYSCFKVIYKT